MTHRDGAQRTALDRKGKAMIIAGIVLAFITAVVPLWNKGLVASLRHHAMVAEKEIEKLENQERTLVASITESRSGHGIFVPGVEKANI